MNAYLNLGLIFGRDSILHYFSSIKIPIINKLGLLWTIFPFPRMGIEGAAIATVIASFFAFLCFLTYYFSKDIIEKFSVNKLSVNYDVIKKQFFDGHGQLISLTEGESGLLHALAQKANIPIRREMLAAQLDMDVNDRAVDVQITRLRKKIEDDPSAPKIILTLRGKGYMLKTDDT